MYLKQKKTLTALVVVGVLLVSAVTINSVQRKTELDASVGSFFSRILTSIFPSKLTPLKQIPKNTETFATEGSVNGNAIFQTEDGETILNLDNIEGVRSLSTHADENGIAYLYPENKTANSSADSYIITFKAEPLSIKTKKLLDARGVTIFPQGKDTKNFSQQLKNIKPELDAQKTTIANQQNILLTRLSNKYSTSSTEGTMKVFSADDKDIYVRQLKTTLNAVTISNVTKKELDDIVRAIPNIKSIEKAQTVQVDLIETPGLIHSSDLQSYFGANGTSLTGEGTTIAIVDTGVDYTHQDLGECNFLLEGNCKVIYGYDFINNDSDPMDDHGHGTHVAATAGGDGFWTDDQGITHSLPGIAPDAKIYAYKVLDSSGSGSSVAVIQGIEACADPNGDGDISDRVTVCSLSLGGPGGPLDSQSLAVDAAVDAGVVMIIAAGNSGPGAETIGSPGTSRKAITVGAACKPQDIGNDTRCAEGAVAVFSSRGPVLFTDEDGEDQVLNKPDVVSLGVNICAAQWGDWYDEKTCLGDGKHIAINGTSMATPTVAGLIALLTQAHPDKTVAELKETLMLGATDLGFNANTQGQGFVNGLATLESLGLPNSIISISGLPFFVDDIESQQVIEYSKTFTFENISGHDLNLTMTQSSNNPGTTLSFPDSMVLAPGEEGAFFVSMTIDHSEALSGRNIKETILISDGEESINLLVGRRTPNYLIPESLKVSFGLFNQSQESFSKTVEFDVSNRLSEQTVTYDVVIDESTLSLAHQNNISVTPSVDQITLGPSESISFDLVLDAISVPGNTLSNKIHKVNLQLISELETINVELSFFKGYAFEFGYGPVRPDVIVLNGGGWTQVYVPNPQLESLILYSTQPGPFHAKTLYIDQSINDSTTTTAIFEFDILLLNQNEIPYYDVSKNRAEHRIENNYFGNSCFERFQTENGLERKSFAMSISGKVAFEYNTVPEDVNFSLICAQLIPQTKRIIVSQIYLTEGLNQDFSLNDATADISSRYLYAFNNREEEDVLSIGLNICSFINFKHPGAVRGRDGFCSFWFLTGNNTLDLIEGETAVVEVRSLHTDTPETASTPDYPSFKIYVASKSQETYLYTSADMFGTSEKLYAWSDPDTGILSTSESTVNTYEKYKVPVVNDNFITIGTGPLTDTTMVKAYRDDFGRMTSWLSDYKSIYRYADGSTESHVSKNPNKTKTNYDLFRNGSFVDSMLAYMDSNNAGPNLAGINIPDTDGNFKGFNYTNPVIGEYDVYTQRVSLFDGEEQDREFSTDYHFSISEDIIDSIPPVIKHIQLVANGILQNHFEPNSASELRIYATPGFGIASHNLEEDDNDAYEIEFMDDSISTINISAGENKDSLSLLSDPVLVGDYYSFDLSGVEGSGSKKYFQLFLEDLSGNTITYNFYIEVGDILDPETIADEGLAFCENNPHSISISKPTVSLVSGGDFVPVTFTLTNEDSLACEPTSYNANMSVDTDQYHPMFGNGALKIRGKGSLPADNLFTTTGFSYFITSLTPGQSFSRTGYFRADVGFPEGQYQIGFTIPNPDNAGQQVTIPFYADIQIINETPDPEDPVDEDVPAYCAGDFNSDGAINTADQLLFNTVYGTLNPIYDLDGSGGPVNANDIITFLSYYGSVGCPSLNPAEEVDQYTDVANEESISISYDIQTTNPSNPTVYEYTLFVTNNSNQTITNLVATNLVPEAQLLYAEFVAASVPNLGVDLETGNLYIPSIGANQLITVLITVTIP